MWKLQLHDDTLMSRELKCLHLPIDEIVIYAAIRKGPTIHSKKETHVRLIHVAEFEPGMFLTFWASLLESTYLEARYPEYSQEGIMGKWLLHNSEGGPKLKFLQKHNGLASST